MHNWPPDHHLHGICDRPRGTCEYVVEQHQDFEPEGKVPEFTISVKWQEGDLFAYLAGRQSQARGWRYVMRWVEGGKQRHITAFGFGSDQAAREAAEARATKIVKAQRGEKVYKFKPNLED